MKNLLMLFIFIFSTCSVFAQTVFVDPVRGSDSATGTQQAPVKSLLHAVSIANEHMGQAIFTIKLLPGLYVLRDKVVLERRIGGLTIEALHLPGDPEWSPYKMPVINSVSGNNSTVQFAHSTGILVAMDSVKISGIKFTGNPNPSTSYYYPISRKDTSAVGLEVSQCYFIGERSVAPVQAAIWAHGSKIDVHHCIFYGCKNALVLIDNIRDFSLTNSIVYGAYEAAVWYGDYLAPFKFSNNIVSDCNFVWLRVQGSYPAYEFQNTLFAGNRNLMGYFTNSGLISADRNEHIEKNVQKSCEKVELVRAGLEGLKADDLHVQKGSAGAGLQAGIFK